MFHKILVAIDHSESSKKIFDESLALAKSTGASLTLCQVLSQNDENTPELPTTIVESYTALDGKRLEIYREQWQSYAEQSRERLRSLIKEATIEGVPTNFVQGSGSPGQEICRFAQSLEVDLIILGRRGRSGLTELLLGSVSNYVLHHTSCSVFILQGCAQAVSDGVSADRMALGAP